MSGSASRRAGKGHKGERTRNSEIGGLVGRVLDRVGGLESGVSSVSGSILAGDDDTKHGMM